MLVARVPVACFGLVLCAAVGALAASPLAPGLGVLMGGAAVVVGIRTLQSSARIPFIAVLILALFGGYIILNRNFAELHVPLGSLPVYVGELMLVVAIPWALSYRSEWDRLKREPFFAALLAWQAYSAGRLLAGGLDYGIDALRDSAIWYYGLYAIVGYVLWPLVPRKTWTWFFTAVFLGLIAVTLVFVLVGPLSLPIPGADPRFPTSADRADVMSVSLVSGAAFFLLMLRGTNWYWLRVLLAGMCLGLVLPLEVRAASIGFVILLGVLASQRKWRTLATLTIMPLAALLLVVALSLQVSGRYGIGSAGTLIDRQLSTLPLLFEGKAASANPNVDTAAWRVAWWTALLSETTSSFDTTIAGLGYGTDLTGPLQAQFGVQVDERGRPVRSPHNILVTLFARSGLLGLGLWIAMHWIWVRRVATALRRSGPAGLRFEADQLLWLSGYVLLIVVSATLGVVLEGPYGAIPYFLLLGMSLRCASMVIEVADVCSADDQVLYRPVTLTRANPARPLSSRTGHVTTQNTARQPGTQMWSSARVVGQHVRTRIRS